MGKGDKKSKKGKMAMGSFGNSRPQKPQNHATSLTLKKPAQETAK